MAKKKVKVVRYLLLPNGERFEITGETGKYWLCGDTQFRKSHGWAVLDEPVPIEDKKEGDEN